MRKTAFSICLLFLLSLTTLYAQGFKFSGQVVDSDGVPVTGAGVVCLEKNTIGTTADLDGRSASHCPPPPRQSSSHPSA